MNKFYLARGTKFLSAFLTPVFLLLLFSSAMAQSKRYTITGKVADATTKETIPGVGVKIQSLNFGAATNTDGVYTLTADLAPGTYQMVFSYIGYKSVIKPITLGSDNSITVNAEISADAVGLDEIIVTGTSQGTTRI